MRRLEINPSGYWYLSLTLLLGIVAILTHNNVLYLIESLLLSGILFSGILSERTVRPIEVEYRRRQAQAKTPSHDLIRVRNHSRFTHFCVEIGEWRGGKFHTLAYLPRLGAEADIIIPSVMLFEKRGVHRWSGLAVATSYPFGLTRKIKVIWNEGERLVWPEGHGFRPQDNAGGRDAAKRIGNEYAEGEIRQYVPEDDCRSILWTLSAKGMGQFVRLRKSSDRDSRIVLDLREDPGPDFEKKVVAVSEPFYRMRGSDPTAGTLVLIEADGSTRAFHGRVPALNQLATVQALGQAS